MIKRLLIAPSALLALLLMTSVPAFGADSMAKNVHLIESTQLEVDTAKERISDVLANEVFRISPELREMIHVGGERYARYGIALTESRFNTGLSVAKLKVVAGVGLQDQQPAAGVQALMSW